jgi:hypothetical protein
LVSEESFKSNTEEEFKYEILSEIQKTVIDELPKTTSDQATSKPMSAKTARLGLLHSAFIKVEPRINQLQRNFGQRHED